MCAAFGSLASFPLKCLSLGHKQTLCVAEAMSAPLPKADIRSLALPLHDWNGADRIRRRTIDYLRTDSEVDERVPRFIHQAINTSCLEKNACFLTKHLFIFT